MGLIDILILIVLGCFLLKGVLRGLLKEVCSLLGLVLGGLFAFTFHLPLAQLLQDSFDLPAQLCVWGSFLMIFLAVVFCFAAIGFLLNRFVKSSFWAVLTGWRELFSGSSKEWLFCRLSSWG